MVQQNEKVTNDQLHVMKESKTKWETKTQADDRSKLDISYNTDPSTSPSSEKSKADDSVRSEQNEEIDKAAETLLASAGGINSQANNSSRRNASSSRSPPRRRRTRTRSGEQGKEAVDSWEKTAYEQFFEQKYGTDAEQPPDTAWTTPQYRTDSKGLLWQWSGEMNGKRKVFTRAPQHVQEEADDPASDWTPHKIRDCM